MSKSLKFIAICFLSFGLSACATNLPKTAATMPIAGKGYVPAGFKDYCERSPASCGSRHSPEQRISLDEHSWQLLNRVNLEINQNIRPATDQEAFGRIEYWNAPSARNAYGDCEDYAMAKQLALVSNGFSDAALSIATAMEPGKGMHAVLMVRTDRGDFVLDNKTSKIRNWNETPYKWVSLQSARHDLIWERPANPSSDGLTAFNAQRDELNTSDGQDAEPTAGTNPRLF